MWVNMNRIVKRVKNHWYLNRNGFVTMWFGVCDVKRNQKYTRPIFHIELGWLVQNARRSELHVCCHFFPRFLLTYRSWNLIRMAAGSAWPFACTGSCAPASISISAAKNHTAASLWSPLRPKYSGCGGIISPEFEDVKSSKERIYNDRLE